MLVWRGTGSDLSVEWLAFEGSADYRARTLATRESIPIRCKSPHGSICCRGKRLNPFILGGGWYSPVKGPGDSTIRKTDSVDTLGRSPFSAFVLLQ